MLMHVEVAPHCEAVPILQSCRIFLSRSVGTPVTMTMSTWLQLIQL